MSTEQALQQRCDGKCELCGAQSPLSTFEVKPSDGSVDQSVMLCETCLGQINAPETMDSNHWRCLNDSMWSQVPAVHVMAWRQLTALVNIGESWAQEQLDMLYLEEDVRTWAEALSSDEVDDREPTLDSNGAQLFAGDNVTVIKDLNVKGAGFTAKRGTAVRNISLTNNPEHIEGRVNGVKIVLLSCYLKKS